MPNRILLCPITEPLEHRLMLAHIIITRGGTYSGEWESLDPEHPAVVVNTTEKVIIENSTIRSRGPLIASGVNHTNITVRNSRGFGLNPNVLGQSPGRFVTAEDFDNVVLENNYLESTSGIHLLNYVGDRTPSETVRIISNNAKNIDGRRSNGAGGWLNYNRKINTVTGVIDWGFDYAQFVQLDKVVRVPGIEIAWNQVINEPGKSRVEDNINVYLSSGTAASPIRIHNNYIQGAYTIRPTQKSYTSGDIRFDWGFAGGGILLGDGVGRTGAEDPAFVKAYDNQVVGTTNYGIAIAAGHDLEVRNNRVISSALLPDGNKVAYSNVGIYVWDSYEVGPARFHRNTAHHNLVGWVYPHGRNDTWTQQPATIFSNTSLTATPTLGTELAEKARWNAKLAGPRTATVGGTIFSDHDADGVRDTNEAAVPGVRMYLDRNNDKRFNIGEPTSTTNSAGRWELKVTPGEPIFRMNVPSGWSATKGTSVSFVASAAQTYTRDFGLRAKNTTTGSVFHDSNVNGKRDGAEVPLAGWRIFADGNANGKLDAGEVSVLTGKNGTYTFRDLKPGTYRITVMRQANHLLTAPTRGYYNVTITPGALLTAGSFGVKRIV